MKDLLESSLTPIFEINLKIYKFLVINVTSILENRYIKIIVQNREIYKQTNKNKRDQMDYPPKSTSRTLFSNVKTLMVWQQIRQYSSVKSICFNLRANLPQLMIHK